MACQPAYTYECLPLHSPALKLLTQGSLHTVQGALWSASTVIQNCEILI